MDVITTHNKASGREIWTRDQLKQLFDLKFRIVDHGNQAIDYLAQVVWRYLGRHTDRNSFRTIDQQVGVFAGKYQGLFERIIIVGPKLDSLLVEIVEQFMSQPVHADFGITHRRCRVAVNRTEVALAVDQRMTHGEVLGHTNYGVIDRRIAMGMVLTDDVTDNASRFLVRLVVVVVQFVHGEQDPPVNRFKAVPHVR